MLERLIYMSEAAPDLRSPDIKSLLGSAQVRNRRCDVTGVLVFSGRHFLQVLEGRPGALATVMDVIAGDRRHAGVRPIDRVQITKRRYASWAMAFIESHELVDALAALYAGQGTGRTAEVLRVLEHCFSAEEAPFNAR